MLVDGFYVWVLDYLMFSIIQSPRFEEKRELAEHRMENNVYLQQKMILIVHFFYKNQIIFVEARCSYSKLAQKMSKVKKLLSESG